MKINDGLTSQQLKDKLLGYGLDPSGKSTDEMETMLAAIIFAELHPNEEMPDQINPMLASDASALAKDVVDKMLSSEQYIAQDKINGMRSLMAIYPTKLQMTSRARSVKDFMFTPHHQNILGIENFKNPFKAKTVLDGELISVNPKIFTGKVWTHSPLEAIVALVHMEPEKALKIQREGNPIEYVAFDIIYYEGEDLHDTPFEKREEFLIKAVEQIKESNPDFHIRLDESIKDYESAYDLYVKGVKEGKEGLIFRSKSGKYQEGKRPPKDLIKLKSYVGLDGWISGSVESSEDKGFSNLIGGFEVSTNIDGVPKVIAAISNIPLDIRTDATVMVDGKPTLNPKYLNRCVELKGQHINQKSGRLNSARILEWRDDKNPEECKLSMEELMRMYPQY